MNLLQVLVVITTTAAVCAGIVFTVRGFKASARGRAAEPDPATHVHPPIAPHDRSTTELLKRFFDGKSCAVCKRPIGPVQRTGLKPGLLDPATHQAYSWDEIPNSLVATLDTKLPLCASCRVAESFRHRYPDRVLDRERAAQDVHS